MSRDASVLVEEYKKSPLWNEALCIEERLNYLIQELTLEEKIQCLTMRSPDIERLGIKSFTFGTEAAHGVEARRDQIFNKGVPINTTTFTQPIGMSGTWDKEVIAKAGRVVGTEARAIYNKEGNTWLSCWAPTVDMERDPRWGRNEEGYGEDPYLTGKMSGAYIRGIQGDDPFYLRCGATLKHFYANNEEQDREFSSSSLDSRNKYEYYLEPFRYAITEAKAEAVMTSYNEINGIPAIVNNEVQEILKERWGLKGHVVCDMRDLSQTVTMHNYFGTDAETLAAGLKAGIDAFNDPEETVIEAAREALKKGLIIEEDINRAVKRTFSTKIRLGMYDSMDKSPYAAIDFDRLNCQEHMDICLEVAKKAVTLLKNDNQLLPLRKSTQETIAVIGPLADVCNKDWYSGLPLSAVTPYEGIKKEFTDAAISLTDGIDRLRIMVGEQYLAVDEEGGIYLSGRETAEVFEHTDWGDNRHTLRAVSAKKYIAADTEVGSLRANKEEVFSWFVQEVFAFHERIDKQGNKNDKLAIECSNHSLVYISKEGKLLIANESGEVSDNLHCDLMDIAEFSLELVADGVSKAMEVAYSADKVIAVLGCHPIINSKEGVDRTNLFLPPFQRKLLQKIKQVNPNVILVLIANYPYIIDWEQENLPAILTSASGSQDLGTAIAQVISGDYSPAGRLNMTWYLKMEQIPPLRDYDIIQGRRTYQYFKGDVLYPFGYGLSYSKFSYGNLVVTKEFERLKINLVVKNVGKYDSDEVVQLYVSQLYSRTRRPMKQLKGFQRVMIKVGEEVKLQFLLPYEELKYYDVVTGSMILEDSDYQIQIGASSIDIYLKSNVHVDGIKNLTRDMRKMIPCDHYDNYSNLYLYRGHDEKPCMLPKIIEGVDSQPVKGAATYQDACFSVMPKKFIIDLKAEESGSIHVWFGAVKIVMLEVNVMSDFKVLEVPIETESILLGEKKPLRIEMRGRIKVVEFGFRE